MLEVFLDLDLAAKIKAVFEYQEKLRFWYFFWFFVKIGGCLNLDSLL